MLAVATPTPAQEENPWNQGNYWDVSGIHVKDGSGLKYAQFLASSWVKNQEFASMPSPDEADQRAQVWREFNKKTMAQLQAESGARAEYRTSGSQVLLPELVLRKSLATG